MPRCARGGRGRAAGASGPRRDGRRGHRSYEQLLHAIVSSGTSVTASWYMYDDVRFEVSGTQANGPILATLAATATVGLMWKYFVAIGRY